MPNAFSKATTTSYEASSAFCSRCRSAREGPSDVLSRSGEPDRVVWCCEWVLLVGGTARRARPPPVSRRPPLPCVATAQRLERPHPHLPKLHGITVPGEAEVAGLAVLARV